MHHRTPIEGVHVEIRIGFGVGRAGIPIRECLEPGPVELEEILAAVLVPKLVYLLARIDEILEIDRYSGGIEPLPIHIFLPLGPREHACFLQVLQAVLIAEPVPDEAVADVLPGMHHAAVLDQFVLLVHRAAVTDGDRVVQSLEVCAVNAEPFGDVDHYRR